MPWTEITRPHYERRCARYASDLTDEEWALIAPLMPSPNRIGRPRKTDLRELVGRNGGLPAPPGWNLPLCAEGRLLQGLPRCGGAICSSLLLAGARGPYSPHDLVGLGFLWRYHALLHHGAVSLAAKAWLFPARAGHHRQAKACLNAALGLLVSTLKCA